MAQARKKPFLLMEKDLRGWGEMRYEQNTKVYLSAERSQAALPAFGTMIQTTSCRNRMVGPNLAVLLAGVSGGLCLLALLAWLAGAWRWLTLGPGQVPIAPFTAAFLVLLNAAFWVRWQRRADSMARWLADGTTVGIGVAGGLALLRPWLPGLSSLESAVSAAELFLEGMPITLMSPLTGASFAVLAAAYGLQGRASRACRLLACGLALAVAAFSAWVVGAYAVGMPQLPGTDLVPMALLAAQAFLLSSLAVAWAAWCGLGDPPQRPGPGVGDLPGGGAPGCSSLSWSR